MSKASSSRTGPGQDPDPATNMSDNSVLDRRSKTTSRQCFACLWSTPSPGLSSLLNSGLKCRLTLGGASLVVHPSYQGSYPLNTLARRWMRQGRQLCESESGLLFIRLLHVDLIGQFKRLYSESNQAIKSSWIAWLPASARETHIGCRCCLGDPRWCVEMDMRCDDALYFRKEVWTSCFGDEGDGLSLGKEDGSSGRDCRKVGSRSWWTNGQLQQRWKCEWKMIEDALQAGREAKDSCSETDEDWESVEKV